MNLANKLTLIRIILIPVIMIVYAFTALREIYVFTNFPYLSLGNLIILILAALAMLTDFLDGKIARKYNLVSDLGKFLDPLADKLLVLTLLLIAMDQGKYYDNELISWWMVIIILAREFMVTGLRLIAANKKVVIAASWYGKIKTTLQFVTLLLVFAAGCRLNVYQDGISVGRVAVSGGYVVYTVIVKVFIVLMLTMTIYSGFDYFMKSKHLLKDDNKKNKKTKE